MKLLPLALICSIALVACGGSSGAPSDESNSGSDSVWLALLERVPLTNESSSWVQATDYAKIRSVLSISLPKEDAKRDALSIYRDGIFGLQGSQSGIKVDYTIAEGNVPSGIRVATIGGFVEDQYFEPEEWQRELGFNLALIDQQIDAWRGPYQYTVLSGRFDSKHIDSAVKSDPAFKGQLRMETYSGASYYAWGGDFQDYVPAVNLPARTPVRRLGVGGRLSLDGQYLAWTQWTEGMKQVIDASKGTTETLASVPTYRDFANILSASNVYTFAISSYPCSISTIQDGMVKQYGQSAVAAITRDSLLLPYLAVAIGFGQAKSGPFGVLILGNQSQQDARENQSRLQAHLNSGTSLVSGRPWKDHFQDAQISLEGLSVIVRMPYKLGALETHPFLKDVFDQCDRLVLSQ